MQVYQTEKSKEPVREELAGDITSAEAELSTYDELDVLHKLLNDTGADIQRRTNVLETKQGDRKLLEEEATHQKALLSSLKDVEVEAEKAKKQLEETVERSNKLEELSKDLTEFEKTKTRLENVQSGYIRAQGESANQSAYYEKLEKAFFNEQAGIIASKLVDGSPCPVCGSTSHPSPATIISEAPTEEELQKAKQNAEDARVGMQRLSEEAGIIRAKVDMAEDSLLRSAKALLGIVGYYRYSCAFGTANN
jgi:DNA repair protein SbcC/Rad50